MKNRIIVPLLLLVNIFIASISFAQKETVDPESLDNEIENLKISIELLNKIKEVIPNAEVRSLGKKEGFKAVYEIKLVQNLAHNDPSKGTFEHFVYLYHKGFDRPMVMETDGYRAYTYTKELSKILDANQLICEYRFYGKSVQGEIPYQHLKNRQAIEDLHEINTWFKKIYPGKWISSGVSKGGETAIIYKRFYPNDVDISVPYVAPVILNYPDTRTDKWQFEIGEKACRDKVFEFQKTILKRRSQIEPLLEKSLSSREMHFERLGISTILDYAVLEYPFSFWQWGNQTCEEIPNEDATIEVIWNHFNKVNNVDFYSDEQIKTYAPFYYQMYSEMGYYDFPQEHLGDLIKTNPESACFLPEGIDVPKFDPTFVKDIHDWAVNEGNDILYIYGGYDTWTSCAVQPSEKTNAKVFTLKGGSHGTRIKSFSIEERNEIYKVLEEWLDLKVIPLPEKK